MFLATPGRHLDPTFIKGNQALSENCLMVSLLGSCLCAMEKSFLPRTWSIRYPFSSYEHLSNIPFISAGSFIYYVWDNLLGVG